MKDIELKIAEIKKLSDWQNIAFLAKKINDKNHIVYLVGGCVRDLLLGKKPKDFDFTTSADPEELEEIFEETNPLGKAFGTIQVLIGKRTYEVTRFRKDFDYQDGRRPSRVEFSNEKEDVLRRDFTINAILLDPISLKIKDYVDGIKDLEDGIIRFIGDPYLRIDEDKLRILRALRFYSQLGFQIEEKSKKAIIELGPQINKLSKERLLQELFKWVVGSHISNTYELVDKAKIFKTLFGIENLDFNFLSSLADTKKSYEDRLALLLAHHLSDKDRIEDYPFSKSFKIKFNFYFKYLRKVSELDIRKHFHCEEGYFLADYLVKANKWPFSFYLSDINPVIPLLKSTDLIGLGFKGKDLGEAIEACLNYQIENQISDKEDLLKYVKDNLLSKG